MNNLAKVNHLLLGWERWIVCHSKGRDSALDVPKSARGPDVGQGE